MVELLAQVEPAPLEKYFSFIVLGLMLCVGYLLIRGLTNNKKPAGDRDGLETSLLAAQSEVLMGAKERKPSPESENSLKVPEGEGEEDDPLDHKKKPTEEENISSPADVMQENDLSSDNHEDTDDIKKPDPNS